MEKNTQNVESDNVVYINRWNDQPKLNANWSDNANDNWRPLVHDSLSRMLRRVLLGGANPAAKHLADFL